MQARGAYPNTTNCKQRHSQLRARRWTHPRPSPSQHSEDHKAASTKPPSREEEGAKQEERTARPASCQKAAGRQQLKSTPKSEATTKSSERTRDANFCATAQWTRSRPRAHPQCMPAIACSNKSAINATGISIISMRDKELRGYHKHHRPVGRPWLSLER